jgi:hypothetical protein
MAEPDFRALCTELVDDLEDWAYPPDENTAATYERISRARAALSQPAPEPPMDKQWEDEALNAYRTASIDPGTSTLTFAGGRGMADPTPDFRDRCAELVNVLDNLNHFPTSRLPSSKIAGLVDRARAALAQPAPEPPTNEELENTYNRAVSNYLCSIKAKRTLVDDDLADSRFAGLRAVYNRGQGNG